MSLACFPNVKFPDVHEGKQSLTNFMVAYGLGHPIIQDMKGARAFEHDGRTFILMDGVVAYHEDGDDLSRRVSVALALTTQRNYLVSFFFAAPHDAELHQLMNAKAAFDPEPVIETATAKAKTSDTGLQSGGSAAATPSATAASETSSANLQTASTATSAEFRGAGGRQASSQSCDGSVRAKRQQFVPSFAAQTGRNHARPADARQAST